jgi:hypothetical protein
MSAESLYEIQNSQENFMCFECGYKNSGWACLEHSIFLCIDCAHQLKSQCSNLVLIKSLQMPGWTSEEISKLQIGGNQRLRSLFLQYNLPRNYTTEQKYSCQAALYYRNLLKAELYNYTLPTAPGPSEGMQLVGYTGNSWWQKTKNSLTSLGAIKDSRIVQGIVQGFDGQKIQNIKNSGVNALCGLRAFANGTSTSALLEYKESFSPEYVGMEQAAYRK